jgi:hypothetical protein
MKLTEERLVKMILEELDAMGEVYRAKGESPEEYDARKAQADSAGAKGLNTMGKSRRRNELAFKARPTLLALKADPRKTVEVGKDVYDYIESRGDVDMTRLSIRED